MESNSKPLNELTPEEQIARGLCPIKQKYLRPVTKRLAVPVVTGSSAVSNAQQGKKSRKQEKKVRLHASFAMPPGSVSHRVGHASRASMVHVTASCNNSDCFGRGCAYAVHAHACMLACICYNQQSDAFRA